MKLIISLMSVLLFKPLVAQHEMLVSLTDSSTNTLIEVAFDFPFKVKGELISKKRGGSDRFYYWKLNGKHRLEIFVCLNIAHDEFSDIFSGLCVNGILYCQDSKFCYCESENQKTHYYTKEVSHKQNSYIVSFECSTSKKKDKRWFENILFNALLAGSINAFDLK